MKKLWGFIVVVGMLFAVAGCKAGNNAIDSPASEDDTRLEGEAEGKEISGRLVISIPYLTDSWIIMTEEFKKKYPDVELVIRSSNQSGELFTGQEMDEYLQQMAVDLMGGSDVDIFETSWLSFYKYAQSGVLEDLYPYMDQDKKFEEEDYYMNIFSALSWEGKLCMLPTDFTYDAFRLNKNILGEEAARLPDSMDYKQLFELYDRVSESEKNPLFSRDNTASYSIFDRHEFLSFIDMNRLSVSFDTPEFQDYLTTLRKYPLLTRTEGVIYQDIREMNGDEYFCNFFRFMLPGEKEESNSASRIIRLVPSSGEGCFTAIGGMAAISSFSKNKELAWEFLRFMIEEKDYPFEEYAREDYLKIYPYLYYIPVNRKNYKKRARALEMTEDQITYWDEVNQSLTVSTFVDVRMNEIIDDIRTDYLEGRLSPEDYTKQMQERLEIYFKE